MKKLLCIIILLIIILSISNVAFAEDIDLRENLPDATGYTYRVLLKDTSGYPYYVVCSKPFQYESDRNILWIERNHAFKIFKYSSGAWSIDANYSNYTSDHARPFIDIYLTSHDILYKDSSTVFFSAPKVSPIISTMKTMTPGKVWKTILIGLTPIVGLIVLSIALMKGLAFLRHQLTH